MADQSTPTPHPPRPASTRRRTAIIIGAVVVVALIGVGLVVSLRATEPTATGPTATDASIPPAGPSTQLPSPFPSYNGNSADDNVLYNITLAHDAAVKACPELGTYRPKQSDEDTKAAIESALACLMALNTPALAEYEIELPDPTVRFYTDEVTTACGDAITDHSIGEYCMADKTMYFSLTALRTGEGVSTNPLAIYFVAAHEFGHYIQHMTNIVAGTPTSATESRRIELQATCTAGMFINAAWTQSGATEQMIGQTHSMFDVLYADQAPGQGTYGTPETTSSWFDRGYADGATSSYADCNTFTVSPGEIR